MASSTQKIRLTLLVDIKAKKVVFAEAKKDLVDFLCDLLSLPINTLVRLLKDNATVLDSFGNLYRSIEALSNEYMLSDKNTVLKPSGIVRVPLLSVYDAPPTLNYSSIGNGYVKEVVKYMVLDNLEIKPLTTTLIKSHTKNVGSLTEKDVEVGFEEGLAILKACFETQDVLTAVFLTN